MPSWNTPKESKTIALFVVMCRIDASTKGSVIKKVKTFPKKVAVIGDPSFCLLMNMLYKAKEIPLPMATQLPKRLVGSSSSRKKSTSPNIAVEIPSQSLLEDISSLSRKGERRAT